MMRKIQKALAFIIITAICVGTFATTAFADTKKMYEANSKTTLKDIQTAIDGDYDGVSFAEGTYTLSKQDKHAMINLTKSFDFVIPENSNVTLESGLAVQNKKDVSISVTGKGSLTLDGTNASAERGLYFKQADGTKFNTDGIDFTVKNFSGYGSYTENTNVSVEYKNGNIQFMNNSKTAEGGIEFDGGSLLFDNCNVLIDGNGNTSFGAIYAAGDLTFMGSTKAELINNTSVKNTIVLTGDENKNIFGTMSVIGNGTEVKIKNNGSHKEISRGINVGFTKNVINITDGAVLTIDSADAASTSKGVRGSIGIPTINVTNNGKLNILNTDTSLESVNINSDNNDLINIASKATDLSANSKAVITGGSVLMQPAQSVVNGVKVDNTVEMVKGKVVNTYGETLTRFDISNLKNTVVEIGATDDNEAYSYKIGENNNGVAYVWAPEVSVNFYNAKDFADLTSLGNRITARGNNLTFVNASINDIEGLLTVPAGQAIVWKNCDDDSVFDLNTPIIEDTNVYATFVAAELPPVIIEDETPLGPTPVPSPTPSQAPSNNVVEIIDETPLATVANTEDSTNVVASATLLVVSILGCTLISKKHKELNK